MREHAATKASAWWGSKVELAEERAAALSSAEDALKEEVTPDGSTDLRVSSVCCIVEADVDHAARTGINLQKLVT